VEQKIPKPSSEAVLQPQTILMKLFLTETGIMPAVHSESNERSVRNMVRVIDVHNHFYPKKWLDYLEKRTESPRLEWKGPDSALFFSKNTVISSIRFPGHYDAEARIEDLARFGIDIQVLSFTMPTLDFLPVEQEIEWARRINDSFADVCRKFPGRFYSFATLPFSGYGCSSEGIGKGLQRTFDARHIDVFQYPGRIDCLS
jgi:hypothetical protein